MSYPILQLSEVERAVIYTILRRIPGFMTAKWEIKVRIFGITIHPSVSIKGVIADAIGEDPNRTVAITADGVSI